jgi:hypothetical protein
MYFWFLKFGIGLSMLTAFIIFIGVEFNSPIDLISYVSQKIDRSVLDTKLVLQAVSLIFLWFAGLLGLILFAKTPIRTENTKIRS